jgi:hypothetical protein
LKTFWGRRASLLFLILLGAWRSTAPWRSEAPTIFVRSAWSVCLKFRSPIPLYNGSAGWPTTMLVVWTPKRPSQGRCAANTHGLQYVRYAYGPANLVGRPGCVTSRGRCALVALPTCSGHLELYVRMKASLWGSRLVAQPSTSWCLGAFDLRPSYGWHASSGSTRLLLPCRISGCLYTQFVRDLHIFS